MRNVTSSDAAALIRLIGLQEYRMINYLYASDNTGPAQIIHLCRKMAKLSRQQLRQLLRMASAVIPVFRNSGKLLVNEALWDELMISAKQSHRFGMLHAIYRIEKLVAMHYKHLLRQLPPEKSSVTIVIEEQQDQIQHEIDEIVTMICPPN